MSDVWDFVDVELGEVGVGEFVGELDDLRSDNLAGSAPGSETIQNNDLVVLEGGGEISLAVREVLLARFPWKYQKTTRSKYPAKTASRR